MSSLTTIPRDAQKTAGGLAYVLLANYADVSTSIDASGYCGFDPSSSTAWTKFILTKEGSNWTDVPTGNPTAGSQFYVQTLTLVFGRNDTVKRNNVYALGTSEVVAVVRENSGNNICLGSENGLDMTSGGAGSGTAMGDTTGVNIVLSGNEPKPYAFVTDASLAEITP